MAIQQNEGEYSEGYIASAAEKHADQVRANREALETWERYLEQARSDEDKALYASEVEHTKGVLAGLGEDVSGKKETTRAASAPERAVSE